MEAEKTEHQLIIEARDASITVLAESPAGFTAEFHDAIRAALKNEDLTSFEQVKTALESRRDNCGRYFYLFTLQRVSQPRHQVKEFEPDHSCWQKDGFVQVGDVVIRCFHSYNFYDG